MADWQDMNLKRSLYRLSLATGTLLAASLGVLLPVAAADSPCSQQGKEVVCAYSYSAGLRSTTIPGGAKGVKVKVEAWGGEGGGSEKEKRDWSWPGGLGGYATNTYEVAANASATIYFATGRSGWWVSWNKYPSPAAGGGSTIITSAWPPRGIGDVLAIAGGGGGSGGEGYGGAGGISGPGQNAPLNAFGEGNGGKGGAGGKGGGGGRPGGSGLGGPGGVACTWQTAACYPPWAVDLGGSGGDTTYAVGAGFTVGGGGGGWGGGGSGFDWGFPAAGGGGGSYPASGVFGQPRYGNGSVQITFASPVALNSPASRRARCSVRGTSGPDVLVGAAGDVVCGAGGDDEITIHGGGAIVYGGAGNDRIVLGGGDDVAYGGRGDDRLWGANGSDTLVGEGGHDQLRGDAGSDTCLDFDRGTVLRSCEQDLNG